MIAAIVLLANAAVLSPPNNDILSPDAAIRGSNSRIAAFPWRVMDDPFGKTRVASRLLGAVIAILFLHSLNSSAQSLPRFTNIQPLTNREVALTLAISNGPLHRINISSNLANWNNLITLPSAVSSITHTDSAPPFTASRFYRAEQLNGTNFLVGDHLATTNGDVVFRPIVHGSFLMSWNNRYLFIDPTNTAQFSGYPSPDIILVSHNHPDHFQANVLTSLRGANTVIISPLQVYNNSGMAAIRPFTFVLTNGTATNISGINVESVPAYNSFHNPGAGNGYVLTLGGKRIYIAGDTGNTTEMRALANIDVAFLCINLPYTMNIFDATNAVRAFRPCIVYPYHYKNQTGEETNAAAFKQILGTQPSIEVRLRKWY